MTLDDLPAELLHHICAESCLLEIKQLRLVSKRISAVADEYLLSTLELYYARESLDLAAALVSRPRIAKNLRFICFHADRLDGQRRRRKNANFHNDDEDDNTFTLADWNGQWHPQNWIYNRWAGGSRVQPDNPLRITSQTTKHETYTTILETNSRAASHILRSQKVHTETAYARYLARLEEQTAIDNSGAIKATFQALFQACPNLADVVVTAGDSLAPTTTWRLKGFYSAVAFPHSDPRSLESGVHAWTSILEAAAVTHKKLNFVGAGRLSHRFFLQNRDLMGRLGSSLHNVKQFVLQLETPFAENLEREGENVMIQYLNGNGRDAIPGFLANAHHLQELTIILPGRRQRIDLRSIVGKACWPSLRKFRIEWFSAREEELVNFLLSLKNLEHLHLADVHIRDGCFPRVLSKIANKLPTVTSVRLRGRITDQHRSSHRSVCCDWHFYGVPDEDIETIKRVETIRRTRQIEEYIRTGHFEEEMEEQKVVNEIEPYLHRLLKI